MRDHDGVALDELALMVFLKAMVQYPLDAIELFYPYYQNKPKNFFLTFTDLIF